jgi:hypothetical protein
MAEYRDYRLIVELGLDPEVVDRTPGHRLDWLLLIHDTKRDVQIEMEKDRA